MSGEERKGQKEEGGGEERGGKGEGGERGGTRERGGEGEGGERGEKGERGGEGEGGERGGKRPVLVFRAVWRRVGSEWWVRMMLGVMTTARLRESMRDVASSAATECSREQSCLSI